MRNDDRLCSNKIVYRIKHWLQQSQMYSPSRLPIFTSALAGLNGDSYLREIVFLSFGLNEKAKNW